MYVVAVTELVPGTGVWVLLKIESDILGVEGAIEGVADEARSETTGEAGEIGV